MTFLLRKKYFFSVLGFLGVTSIIGYGLFGRGYAYVAKIIAFPFFFQRTHSWQKTADDIFTNKGLASAYEYIENLYAKNPEFIAKNA